MCLRAMSRDFLEIVLPNPVLSVAAAAALVTVGFGAAVSRGEPCPLLCSRGLDGDCRRLALAAVATSGAGPVRTVSGRPGRDLPAETGLSGTFVRRFGGTTSGKSGGTTGWGGGGLAAGTGELGRAAAAAPLLRPTDGERATAGAGAGDCARARRVGVDGRELDRGAAELVLESSWGRAVGVEGLEEEEYAGRVLSPGGGPVAGLVLTGVEEREATGREVCLEVDDELGRLPGVDGLEEVTEAMLVLRADTLPELLEEWAPKMEARATELLLAVALAGVLLSDSAAGNCNRGVETQIPSLREDGGTKLQRIDYLVDGKAMKSELDGEFYTNHSNRNGKT